MKPVKLIYKLAELLKTPNPQTVFFPFGGAGSEIIGFLKAGFDPTLMEVSELSPEYVDIANSRIEFWKDKDMEEYIETGEIKTESGTEELEEW